MNLWNVWHRHEETRDAVDGRPFARGHLQTKKTDETRDIGGARAENENEQDNSLDQNDRTTGGDCERENGLELSP